MRKAAATRVLVLLRFLFLSGLPPLVGTWGAKVTWETICLHRTPGRPRIA